VIGSPERIARLDEVKKGLRALADPRSLSAAEADRLLRELPPSCGCLHAVHGNEVSSSDAALALAYHLLAAQDDPAAELARREALVIIDPLENPDGARGPRHDGAARGRHPTPSRSPPSTTSRGREDARTTTSST